LDRLPNYLLGDSPRSTLNGTRQHEAISKASDRSAREESGVGLQLVVTTFTGAVTSCASISRVASARPERPFHSGFGLCFSRDLKIPDRDYREYIPESTGYIPQNLVLYSHFN
jgi:hypothetical protein